MSDSEKGLDVLAIEALPVWCPACGWIEMDLYPGVECPQCGRPDPDRISLTVYAGTLAASVPKEFEEEAEKLAFWVEKQERLIADYFRQVPGADTPANRTEFLRNMKKPVRELENKVFGKGAA